MNNFSAPKRQENVTKSQNYNHLFFTFLNNIFFSGTAIKSDNQTISHSSDELFFEALIFIFKEKSL